MKLEKKKDPLLYKFFIIYGVIFSLLIFISRIANHFNLGIKCLFKSIFKIPCLTCGSTRVMLNLSFFKIKAAFFSNPLIFLIVFSSIVLMLIAVLSFIFNLPKYEIILSKNEERILIKLIVALIIINWIYLIIARI